MDPSTFGERLTVAIERRGLTHEALAERLGLTRGAINHWTNGRRTPPTETIEQLAHELRVRAAWLAFGDGDLAASAPPDPQRPGLSSAGTNVRKRTPKRRAA